MYNVCVELRKITGFYLTLEQGLKSRKAISIGYAFDVEDYRHLTITWNGTEHNALCPICYEPKLRWDNAGITREDERNEIVRCDNCEKRTYYESVLIGEPSKIIPKEK